MIDTSTSVDSDSAADGRPTKGLEAADVDDRSSRVNNSSLEGILGIELSSSELEGGGELLCGSGIWRRLSRVLQFDTKGPSS
mmetsp:Transcript_42377/g.57879  ORF Transcript_42377/g.57879 Transcript_42377/m.57879 type:complete len:82 (+) Transcript_42377:357-602(+)